MDIDRQYTDTHGASIVEFAFADTFDFNLMPGHPATPHTAEQHAGLCRVVCAAPGTAARVLVCPYRTIHGLASMKMRPCSRAACVFSSSTPVPRSSATARSCAARSAEMSQCSTTVIRNSHSW
jgi:hypothetical protein